MSVRPTPGSRYAKDGTVYRIVQLLDNKGLEVEDENTKRRSTISEPELVKCLCEGKVRFLKNEMSNGKSIPSCPDLSIVSNKYQEIVKLRYECIKPLLNMSSRDRTKDIVSKRIDELISNRIFNKITKDGKKVPHITTVYRWIRAYEETGNDFMALLPSYQNSGAGGKPRIDQDVEELIDDGIQKFYFQSLRPNIQKTYEHIQGLIINANKTRQTENQLPLPSYPTINRRVKALNAYEVTQSRFDTIEAEKQCGTKQAGLKPTRPLEIVEMDHTKLDVFVVDGETGFVHGRPWITFMKDKYSRYPLGFYISFNEPSYLSVMYCLHHAINPKDYVHEKYPEIKNTWTSYGLPETLVVDNGKEFYSLSLENACRQLNINLQYCPPGMPGYKGSMERAFGTLNEMLLNSLPGKSFSSYDQRGSYDPVKDASLSFESFLEILHVWIIDKDCKRFHRGAKDVPQDLWDTGVDKFPVNLPYKKEELIVLLGELITRNVTDKGMEFKNLFYNSRELTKMKNTYPLNKILRVQFKFDPKDMSRIWVFNEKDNRYLEVEAIDQKYTKNLTLFRHEINVNKVKEVKNKVNQKDLRETDARINKIVEEEKIKLNTKRKASSRISKYDNVSSSESLKDEQKTNPSNTTVSVKDTPQHMIPNPGNENQNVSDIGTKYNNTEGFDSEPNISELERIGKISAKDITIIEGQEKKPVKKTPMRKQTPTIPDHETRPVQRRKTIDEEELELDDWEVSFKKD